VSLNKPVVSQSETALVTQNDIVSDMNDF